MLPDGFEAFSMPSIGSEDKNKRGSGAGIPATVDKDAVFRQSAGHDMISLDSHPQDMHTGTKMETALDVTSTGHEPVSALVGGKLSPPHAAHGP